MSELRAAGPALLAANIRSQQKLGIAVAVLLVLGWALYLAIQLRHRSSDEPPGSEIELAPNRKKYYDDEALEGPVLERTQLLAFFCLLAIAVGLPLYWAREPARAKAHKIGFENRSSGRGFLMFQPADSPLPTHNVGHFGCATCHGAKGEGGATSFIITDLVGNPRKVQWKAPALNTVLLRYTPDTVRTILIYGRANTPMPAWGVAGGGPMNEQQIADLVEYLKSIQISPEEAQKQGQAAAEQLAKTEGKAVPDGEVLFNVNCARCHTKGWSYDEPQVPAAGAYGPNLTNGDALRQFTDRSDHVSFVTKGAEFGKLYGARGVGQEAPAVRSGTDPGLAAAGGGMPHFGNVLTPDQIEAIVDYERSL